MIIRVAERISQLPPYIFSEINALKAKARRNNVELLNLGIGDPDLATPEPVVTKMIEAVRKAHNHAYSPYEGSEMFGVSARNWLERRFGVSLRADQFVALIGSKEGISHFPMAFINPGDTAIFPSPGYPIFESSILLAGGRAIALPL